MRAWHGDTPERHARRLFDDVAKGARELQVAFARHLARLHTHARGLWPAIGLQRLQRLQRCMKKKGANTRRGARLHIQDVAARW